MNGLSRIINGGAGWLVAPWLVTDWMNEWMIWWFVFRCMDIIIPMADYYLLSSIEHRFNGLIALWLRNHHHGNNYYRSQPVNHIAMTFNRQSCEFNICTGGWCSNWFIWFYGNAVVGRPQTARKTKTTTCATCRYFNQQVTFRQSRIVCSFWWWMEFKWFGW